MGSDHGAFIVAEAVTDHQDVVDLAAGVDDPLTGAERIGGVQDVVDGGRGTPAVLGMLV